MSEYTRDVDPKRAVDEFLAKVSEGNRRLMAEVDAAVARYVVAHGLPPLETATAADVDDWTHHHYQGTPGTVDGTHAILHGDRPVVRWRWVTVGLVELRSEIWTWDGDGVEPAWS